MEVGVSSIPVSEVSDTSRLLLYDYSCLPFSSIVMRMHALERHTHGLPSAKTLTL
jgi:hypothetical protein